MYGESFSAYKTLSKVWLLYLEVNTALREATVNAYTS